MPSLPVRLTVLALGMLAITPARAGGDDWPSLGKAGDFTLMAPEVEEDAPSGWYLRADGGYLLPDVSGTRTTLLPAPLPFSGGASGWSVGGGLGYRFTPWLRAEAEVSFFDLGGAGGPFGVPQVRSTAAFLNAYWDVISLGGFTPYLGAGIGYGVTSVDAGVFPGGSSNSWNLAWSLMAGIAYEVLPGLDLDLGYRYVDFGAPDVAGVAFHGISAQEIRLGLRYALK